MEVSRAIRSPGGAVEPPIEVFDDGVRDRGVRAIRNIQSGEFIERSHVIVILRAEWSRIETTILADYRFLWDEEDSAIALGFASLFNHSYSPNARYYRVLEKRELHFFALRDIAEGEALTVNYNGDPDDESPLWFAPR